MDKLRRMEIFTAVAETGQFTRAAKALSLSKSAVSHAIKDLENYLQVQLLTRKSRGLQLTEVGRSYLKTCQTILADIEELEDHTRQAQEIVSGRIRVTAPTVYGSRTLVPFIAEFSARHPDINIDMETSERHVDILEEGYDLAIRIGELSDSALVARKLSSIRSILCASPEFAKRHADIKTLADLEQVDCLKYTRTPVWRLYVNGKPKTLSPKGPIISNSGDAIRELAIAGSGAAFMPEFLCREALDSGKLVRLLPQFEGRSLDVHAVMPPHRHRPVRVRRLLEFLVTKFEASA